MSALKCQLTLLFIFQYVNVAKDLPGFNSLDFPHCLSSVRGDGYVIPRLTSKGLEFVACSSTGETEGATVQLEWKLYQEHLLQEDGSIVIAFQHEDNSEESRSVHIRTIYVRRLFTFSRGGARAFLLCLTAPWPVLP